MGRFASLVLVSTLAVACLLGLARVAMAATLTSWASSVSAACARSQVRFDRLPKSDGTLAQLLVVLPKLTTMSADLLADVRRVPVPASERSAVRRLVRAAWDDEVAFDKLAYARLKVGDMPGFQNALARTFADSKIEDSVLRALGTTCRRVP